jgi:hypothetical protein
MSGRPRFLQSVCKMNRKQCKTDWTAAGWLQLHEKRGEETRGRDSRSPDGMTDGQNEAPERENASKSMPNGVTRRRMDSRIAVWTPEPPERTPEPPDGSWDTRDGAQTDCQRVSTDFTIASGVPAADAVGARRWRDRAEAGRSELTRRLRSARSVTIESAVPVHAVIDRRWNQQIVAAGA